MKILRTVCLALLLHVACAKSELELKESVSSTTTTEKDDDPLISSLNRIVNKVQSLKTRVEQVLNETAAVEDQDYFKRNGYSYRRGIGYHKLYLSKLSWPDALRFCRKENAHLAVVGSLAEANALADTMKERLPSGSGEKSIAYVGIRDQCKTGSWINIFFESVDGASYVRWAQESRARRNDPEASCAAIDESGYLNSVDCSQRQAFFCEIDL